MYYRTGIIKLVFLLLSFSVQAFDLEARRNGDGYAFRFVQDSVVYCWGMPDLVDLNYFSPTWMRVTDTAQAYSWPFGDATFATMCNESLSVPRTGVNAKLYTINSNLTITASMSIPAWIPCGEQVASVRFLRTVTYNGMKGFSLCF